MTKISQINKKVSYDPDIDTGMLRAKDKKEFALNKMKTLGNEKN